MIINAFSIIMIGLYLNTLPFSFNLMRSFILLILLALALPQISFSQKNQTQYVKVVRIIDGDTFEALTKEKATIKVRLNGIDCPERKQDHYQVCKDALGKFIFGKNVKLLITGKDRYRRILADVYVQKQHINLLMIEEGFAWHYKKYSKNKIMADAEIKARKSGLGLWQNKNALPPWSYKRPAVTKK